MYTRTRAKHADNRIIQVHNREQKNLRSNSQKFTVYGTVASGNPTPVQLKIVRLIRQCLVI